jgi:SAM-dependent MidA family methyltransferase
MGSSVQFCEIFACEPHAAAGVPFARFMELALYHPQAGYYANTRRRVGRDARSDFFTAVSLGPVFGELVVAAAIRLLGAQRTAGCTFVEIGVEPDGSAESDGVRGVLCEVAHPFAGYQTISLGQAIAPLPERCVVFSNELFDAQPCHRLVWRTGAWRELGVALRGEALCEVELSALSAEVAPLAHRLPVNAPEGYHLDLPLHSVTLLRTIAAQAWRGLFLAFDYGKTWRQLIEDTPQGTARAYSHHQQSNDLLARPGGQDLTCHVCWDWLAAGLNEAGFTGTKVESQESFFARHAEQALAAIVAAEASRFSARKQALMQLLHPGQMGQKFQVLHALRE